MQLAPISDNKPLLLQTSECLATIGHITTLIVIIKASTVFAEYRLIMKVSLRTLLSFLKTSGYHRHRWITCAKGQLEEMLVDKPERITSRTLRKSLATTLQVHVL